MYLILLWGLARTTGYNVQSDTINVMVSKLRCDGILFSKFPVPSLQMCSLSQGLIPIIYTALLVLRIELPYELGDQNIGIVLIQQSTFLGKYITPFLYKQSAILSIGTFRFGDMWRSHSWLLDCSRRCERVWRAHHNPYTFVWVTYGLSTAACLVI